MIKNDKNCCNNKNKKKKYIYSRKLNAKHLKKTKLIYTINNIYSYNNKKKIILI